jgi:hypothetical protein
MYLSMPSVSLGESQEVLKSKIETKDRKNWQKNDVRVGKFRDGYLGVPRRSESRRRRGRDAVLFLTG